MIPIDLSKAFDSICHRTLLLKLQGLGASSKASKWFQSYLTDRMQSTRLGTSHSEELIVTHGLPQGSILGPLLFSLYMNDSTPSHMSRTPRFAFRSHLRTLTRA